MRLKIVMRRGLVALLFLAIINDFRLTSYLDLSAMAFNILNDETAVHMHNGMKRKRVDADMQDVEDHQTGLKLIKKGRNFVSISGQAGLYHTENWRGKDNSIFIPVVEDTTIRVLAFDQITYPSNSGAENYFIGDADERYADTVAGWLIHMWKYNKQSRRLFVARSLLFTDQQFYNDFCLTLTDY